jgi:hypothetical protein
MTDTQPILVTGGAGFIGSQFDLLGFFGPVILGERWSCEPLWNSGPIRRLASGAPFFFQ